MHELCDNKQNVLIVIKSDNGCLFGGYSKIGFKTNEKMEEKIDNHSFLFSITKQKIYPVINNTPVIYHYTDIYNGFYIFNSLCFYDGFSKKFSYISRPIKNYFNGLEDIYEMNDGKDKFIIEELEVYQLLWSYNLKKFKKKTYKYFLISKVKYLKKIYIFLKCNKIKF